MAVLPAVLGSWLLRRTVQVRLGTNPAVRLPGGTAIFIVWRQQLMKHPGKGSAMMDVVDKLYLVISLNCLTARDSNHNSSKTRH